MIKPISNHIEEYFAQNTENANVLTARAIFDAKPEDVDIKTDLMHREISLIAGLNEFDRAMKKHHVKQVYSKFLEEYLRLKISLDRKSRMEFVDMHRAKDTTGDVLNTMSQVGNIVTAKK